MKFSVITVCYNSNSYIEETIQSVLGQTYPDFEYIIVDGASEDGTLDIIKKYGTRISKVISEPDNGIYDAMNKGVRVATGDYIVFLNAGDVFHDENVLRDVFKCGMEADIVCGAINVVYKEEAHLYRPGNLKYTDKYMPIPHPGMFINADYHKDNLYDTSYESSGDYDFVYRSVYRNNATFQFIDIVITDYDNEEGMSKNNHKKARIEDLRVKGIKTTPYQMFKINLSSFFFGTISRFKQFTPVWLLKKLHNNR